MLVTEVINVSDVQEYIAVPIVVACFIIGYIIKNHTKISNNNIPTILAITGTVLNIIFNVSQGVFPTLHIVLSGAISGFASCGVYDMIVRMFGIKKED